MVITEAAIAKVMLLTFVSRETAEEYLIAEEGDADDAILSYQGDHSLGLIG